MTSIKFHAPLVPLLTDHEPDPHPDNPNMGDVDAIMESVASNGCYAPVYVSRASNRIVKGHHLYEALREMGATRWPIMWLEGLTPTGEIKILLADNRIARMAKMDARAEAELLRQIAVEPDALLGTGYDDRTMADLMNKIEREADKPLSLTDFGSGHTECPTCGRPFGG